MGNKLDLFSYAFDDINFGPDALPCQLSLHICDKLLVLLLEQLYLALQGNQSQLMGLLQFIKLKLALVQLLLQ